MDIQTALAQMETEAKEIRQRILIVLEVYEDDAPLGFQKVCRLVREDPEFADTRPGDINMQLSELQEVGAIERVYIGHVITDIALMPKYGYILANPHEEQNEIFKRR